MLPFTGRLALMKRNADGAECVGAGQNIGDVDTTIVRSLSSLLIS